MTVYPYRTYINDLFGVTQLSMMAEAYLNPALFKHLVIAYKPMPAYVFVKDKESRYRWCNLNMAKLVGLETAEQIIGEKDVK